MRSTGGSSPRGFGLRLDHDRRKRGWGERDPANNDFTPEAFEASLRRAPGRSDEFVRVYSETPRRWSDDGKRVKLPDAHAAAIRRAREDLGMD